MVASAPDARGHREKRLVSRAEVLSHLALIGTDPWRADEPVRRVSFRSPDAEYLFVHAEKQRCIIQKESFSEDNISFFNTSVGVETYGANHDVTLILGNPVPRMDGIRFYIEFPEGCPLNAVWQRLTTYLSFLSFMANRHVAAQSIRMGKVLKRDAMQPEHEAVLSWLEPEPQGEACPAAKAPFAAWDDEDLASLGQGLSCWIGRIEGWQDAYVRMTACRGSTERDASERLLTAWRWFERLPDTRERKVLDPLAIKPLADAAFAVAQEQGLDISRKRIDGSLRTLCKEGFEQRVRRLVAFRHAGHGYWRHSDRGGKGHIRWARDARGRSAWKYRKARTAGGYSTGLFHICHRNFLLSLDRKGSSPDTGAPGTVEPPSPGCRIYSPAGSKSDIIAMNKASILRRTAQHPARPEA
ncbi:hypothetical protein SAMN06265378_102390 [Paracoccus sediminis]|nr:hypothetical protein SAMN06265378_102390 [Paracoccus sediminis]